MGNGSGKGEVGDAMTEGSNEKGRCSLWLCGSSVAPLVDRCCWSASCFGQGGEGRNGRSEEIEWPHCRKI